MKRMTFAATGVAALFLLLTIGAPSASADIYDFTSCEASGGCGTGPYGDVVLTQDGTSVDVSVNLFDGAQFVQTGSGDGYSFKFVGLSSTTITNADITITSPAPSGGSWVVTGPSTTGLDGDGTGLFDFGISCTGGSCGTGGSNAYAGPIDFTVANTTISQLTVANAVGNFFVADALFANGSTGPTDSEGPVSTPDGGMTLMFLGGVLLGLETLRRRLSV